MKPYETVEVRMLPDSAIEFLEGLEMMAKEAAREADMCADACFSGAASFEFVRESRIKFLRLKKWVEMDIDGMILYMSGIKDKLDQINRLNQSVTCLYAQAHDEEEFIDYELRRGGINADSWFPEDK